MGKFIKGDVVVLPFPFTDLSSAKKRPALILADLAGDDSLYDYVDGEEHDANIMFSGTPLADYIIYMDNGDIEKIIE